MTLKVEELIQRLADVPNEAKLFTYVSRGEIRLQAEWTDAEDVEEAHIGGKPHFKQIFATSYDVTAGEVH